MWGQESRYQDLIPNIADIDISHEEDMQLEEAILEEIVPIEEEVTDIFSSPPEDPIQYIHGIEESRQSVCESACTSILTEQLRQKQQYDKKVNENRYFKITFICLYIYYLRILLDATLRKVIKSFSLLFPNREKCRKPRTRASMLVLLQRPR